MSKSRIEAAKALAAAAAEEGRNLTDEERAQIEAAITDAKSAKADAELVAQIDALGSELAKSAPVVSNTVPAQPAKASTIGERFVTDGAFKSWFDQANVTGTPDPKSLTVSPAVAVGGLKTTITGASDTSAGALVSNDRYNTVETSYARELNLLNLITMGSTNSDAIEYARIAPAGIGGSSISAGPLGETDAATEQTMAFVKAIANVKDIRAFLPASVRALTDAAQLQTLVDGFLRYAILDGVTDQLINGDGTGDNIEGILNVSGVQAQSFDTDMISSVRKGIRKVRHTGNARPTAVLLNPADDEKIDLLSGGNTDYLFGGPASAATPTMWGLTRVVDASVPEGTAIVGDFRKAVWFERTPLSVSVYPQHSDYAVKGLVAIVAAIRGAFAVTNPAAFCTVALD